MKNFLFKHDIPVKKCAADLGISASYLYQILKKERKPSLALAMKIEKYSQGEVTISSLLEVREDFQDPDFLREHQSLIESLVEKKLAHVQQELQEIEVRLRKIERS